jgi:hypothetical protein
MQAYNAAYNRTYQGIHGYLTTVTSLDEQNYVYNTVAKKLGWIGATRMLTSDNKKLNEKYSKGDTIPLDLSGNYNVNTGTASQWYWANGPEAGLVFYKQAKYSGMVNGVDTAYVSNGAGGYELALFANPATGVLIPSAGGSEPNNFTSGGFCKNGEYCAAFANTGALWNDFSHDSDSDHGTGVVDNYYVEYSETLPIAKEKIDERTNLHSASIPQAITAKQQDVDGNEISDPVASFGKTGVNQTAASLDASDVPSKYEPTPILVKIGDADPIPYTEDIALDFSGKSQQITYIYELFHYTLSFAKGADNAKGEMAQKRVQNGIASEAFANEFELRGWSFTGWELSDGTGIINEDDTFTLGYEGNALLTAQWERNVYTVTFIDELTGNLIGEFEVYAGDDATPPTPTTHLDYIFTGWSDTFTEVYSNFTVYAQYMPILPSVDEPLVPAIPPVTPIEPTPVVEPVPVVEPTPIIQPTIPPVSPIETKPAPPATTPAPTSNLLKPPVRDYSVQAAGNVVVVPRQSSSTHEVNSTVQILNADTSVSVTSSPTIGIGGGDVPLYGSNGASWSLFDLILTVFGVLMCTLSIIRAIARKRREEESDYRELHDDEEYEKRKRIRKRALIMLTVFAVVAVILFILTQDITLPMVILDKWSIVFALITVIEIICVARRRRKEEEEEEVEVTYSV